MLTLIMALSANAQSIQLVPGSTGPVLDLTDPRVSYVVPLTNPQLDPEYFIVHMPDEDILLADILLELADYGLQDYEVMELKITADLNLRAGLGELLDARCFQVYELECGYERERRLCTFVFVGIECI